MGFLSFFLNYMLEPALFCELMASWNGAKEKEGSCNAQHAIWMPETISKGH